MYSQLSNRHKASLISADSQTLTGSTNGKENERRNSNGSSIQGRQSMASRRDSGTHSMQDQKSVLSVRQTNGSNFGSTASIQSRSKSMNSIREDNVASRNSEPSRRGTPNKSQMSLNRSASPVNSITSRSKINHTPVSQNGAKSPVSRTTISPVMRESYVPSWQPAKSPAPSVQGTNKSQAGVSANVGQSQVSLRQTNQSQAGVSATFGQSQVSLRQTNQSQQSHTPRESGRKSNFGSVNVLRVEDPYERRSQSKSLKSMQDNRSMYSTQEDNKSLQSKSMKFDNRSLYSIAEDNKSIHSQRPPDLQSVHSQRAPDLQSVHSQRAPDLQSVHSFRPDDSRSVHSMDMRSLNERRPSQTSSYTLPPSRASQATVTSRTSAASYLKAQPSERARAGSLSTVSEERSSLRNETPAAASVNGGGGSTYRSEQQQPVRQTQPSSTGGGSTFQSQQRQPAKPQPGKETQPTRKAVKRKEIKPRHQEENRQQRQDVNRTSNNGKKKQQPEEDSRTEWMAQTSNFVKSDIMFRHKIEKENAYATQWGNSHYGPYFVVVQHCDNNNNNKNAEEQDDNADEDQAGDELENEEQADEQATEEAQDIQEQHNDNDGDGIENNESDEMNAKSETTATNEEDLDDNGAIEIDPKGLFYRTTNHEYGAMVNTPASMRMQQKDFEWYGKYRLKKPPKKKGEEEEEEEEEETKKPVHPAAKYGRKKWPAKKGKQGGEKPGQPATKYGRTKGPDQRNRTKQAATKRYQPFR